MHFARATLLWLSPHPRGATVTGEIRAGQTHAGGLAPNTAVRIASGAPLPIGADAVVALTDTDQGESQVSVNVGVNVGDNVRLQGEDIKKLGRVVVRKGARLGPPQIGAIAADWARARPRPSPPKGRDSLRW